MNYNDQNFRCQKNFVDLMSFMQVLFAADCPPFDPGLKFCSNLSLVLFGDQRSAIYSNKAVLILRYLVNNLSYEKDHKFFLILQLIPRMTVLLK